MMKSRLFKILEKYPAASGRWSEKNLRLLWLGGLMVAIVGSLLPFKGLNDSGYGLDSILHFLLYGFLSFTPLVLIRNRKAAFLLGISMAPLGYLLELTQNLSPIREFSSLDLLANNLGALTGLAAGIAVRFGIKIVRRREDSLNSRDPLRNSREPMPGQVGKTKSVQS